MGVWIRGQNKRELAFVTNIWTYDTRVYASNGLKATGIEIGEYSTEVEALRVLDEIEKHIHDGITYEEIHGKTVMPGRRVFRMPEAGFSARPQEFMPSCASDINHCGLLDGTEDGVCQGYFECKAAWDRGCR